MFVLHAAYASRILCVTRSEERLACVSPVLLLIRKYNFQEFSDRRRRRSLPLRLGSRRHRLTTSMATATTRPGASSGAPSRTMSTTGTKCTCRMSRAWMPACRRSHSATTSPSGSGPSCATSLPDSPRR